MNAVLLALSRFAYGLCRYIGYRGIAVAVTMVGLATPTNAQDTLPLKDTELSAERAADVVVISLPYYMASAEGDTAKYKLSVNSLTPANLPDSGAALSKMLAQSAIPVYDVDRRLLFWVFTVTLQNSLQLRVLAAGNKVIGSPIISVAISGAPDPKELEQLEQLGVEIGKKTAPNASRHPGFVAHSFPRIGLLFETTNKNRFVVDLIHLRPYRVPPVVERYKLPSFYVWSPYDWLILKRFWALVKRFDSVVSERMELLQPASLTDKCVDLTRMTRFEQENGLWCAAATGQMILKFHGITSLGMMSLTQYDIALAMNPPPRDLYFSMATDEGEVNGYNQLLGDDRQAVYMFPPDYDAVRGELNFDRPVRLGSHGHVQALACWRTPETSRQLLVYDPSPQKPEPYWQEWDNLLYEFGLCEPFGVCDTIFITPSATVE